MTILTSSIRVSQLATAGRLNHPTVLFANVITASNITSPNGFGTGGPASNASTGSTFDAAIPTVSSGSTTLVVTGTALRANAACIFAHNLGTIGATVQVQYSTNGSTWVDSGAGSIAPEDDATIAWRFAERAVNHWRLLINNVPSGQQPVIGGMMLGVDMTIEDRIFQGYRNPRTPTEVQLIDNRSEGAHFLGSRFVERGSSAVAEFQHIEYDTTETAQWLAFQNHFNRGRPFLWLWRPTLQYPDAFWAIRGGGVLAPVNTGPAKKVSAALEMSFYHE